MLESVGFETVLAESGAEGIEKAQQIHPDLILLDLVMPDMNGLETAQAIRRIPTLKATPIIAVSASTFDSDRENSLLAGCNAFLSKPLDETTLLSTLSSQLNLEWVEEGVDIGGPITYRNFTVPETVTDTLKWDVPPDTEMNILLDLAMRGDMRGIHKRAAYLSQLNPKYRPFAIMLQQLAKGYEERKLLQLIQEHTNKTYRPS